MYCKNCGNKLSENVVFCRKCGVKIKNAVSDMNKKSTFTKKHMITITVVSFILVLIVGIITVVLLGENRSQDTDVVVENITERAEEISQIDGIVEVTEKTKEIEEAEKLTEVESQYFLVRELTYQTGVLESMIEYDVDGNEVSKVYYNKDGSMKERYENDYDSDGRQVSTIYYSEDGSVNSRWYYEYDNLGNKVSSVSYNKDGNENERCSWEYDSNGNIISFVSYDGNGNTDKSLFKNEYDDAGNCIRSITYAEDGSISVSEEYDENGNIIKHISYNAEGRVEYGFECIYSDEGKIQSYIEFDYEGIWERIEYDSNGNELRHIAYLDDKGTIDHIEEYKNEYDEKGNLLVKEKYLEDRLMRRVEYADNGNILKDTDYNWEGIIYRKEENEYDEQGRFVEGKFYHNDGISFSNIEVFCEYGVHNNLVKRTEINYDENGSKLSYSERFYEYEIVKNISETN